jgi:hypothetical protein
MRIVLLLSSLSLMLIGTAVSAQSDSSSKLRELTAEYFGTCMKDWDKATRMTKKEWERTCRRLANQRAKFRLEHGFK